MVHSKSECNGSHFSSLNWRPSNAVAGGGGGGNLPIEFPYTFYSFLQGHFCDLVIAIFVQVLRGGGGGQLELYCYGYRSWGVIAHLASPNYGPAVSTSSRPRYSLSYVYS